MKYFAAKVDYYFQLDLVIDFEMATAQETVFPMPSEGMKFTREDVPSEMWPSLFSKPVPADFQIQEVHKINNPTQESFWNTEKAEMEAALGGPPTVMSLFHCPKGNIDNILNNSLDVTNAKKGFFGKGIYFSDELIYCNFYSEFKGNPDARRVMLKCSVIMGKTHVFSITEYNTDLIAAPAGYNSIKGQIRLYPEYVVYRNYQVLITHVIFYKFTNAALDEKLPEITGPNVVYITPRLSEMCRKMRAKFPTQSDVIKQTFNRLYTYKITFEEFVSTIQTLTGLVPTQNDIDKFNSELARCKLNLPAAAPAAPIALAKVVHVAPPAPAAAPPKPKAPVDAAVIQRRQLAVAKRKATIARKVAEREATKKMLAEFLEQKKALEQHMAEAKKAMMRPMAEGDVVFIGSSKRSASDEDVVFVSSTKRRAPDHDELNDDPSKHGLTEEEFSAANVLFLMSTFHV